MFAVHPNEAVYAFKSLKRTTISGINITSPLKAKAFEAADKMTNDAEKLGVCNVLYKSGDMLIGHNTDMEGFLGPLIETVGPQFVLNNTAVIIGAGGAARAVLGALLSVGAPEIIMINKTDERVEKLVSQVNVPSLYALPWAQRENAIFGAGLVINATSAGMHGKAPLDINLEYMQPGGWVYDLIYTPHKTVLIKQAKKYGLNTIGGLGMLIAQARPSFKLFYGELPPIGIGVHALVKTHLKSLK